MGLPTNQAKGQGCNPVSSNCVIWQGPDIPCINLCHGDSITDVVFKLAEQLCDILKTLDIDTYDLTCFQPICPNPENFHDLIQFLITKVCELQCCCDGTKPVASDCPDACIVTIAPCFYFVNQIGDTITTMSLTDYVTAIGNKLCTMAAQITTQADRQTNTDAAVAENSARINNIDSQIADLTILLPTSCLLGTPPPGGWPIQTVVTNLETAFCELQTATGTPIELLQAIQQECANMDNLKTLANRTTTYSGISGWVTAANYNTVADSLNNMWLTICDMRAAVENILATCCCTDCDDVNISFTATLESTTLNLFFTGSIPTGLTDCFPTGNLVTITDSNGGAYSVYVPVVSNLNGPAVPINLASTPVNTALDLTIIVNGCWKRPAPGADCGGLECARMLTYKIYNTTSCPTLALIPTTTTIAYSFTNTVVGPVTYVIELYTAASVFVGSQTSVNPPTSSTVSGTFSGLTPGTNYYIQVKVNINGNIKTCPQAFISTLANPCMAPTDVSATNVIA